MTASEFERVTKIFSEASRLDPAERRLYLDEVCGTDAALRAEVESLLDAESSLPTQLADDSLKDNAWRRAGEALSEDEDDALIPEKIGPYRIHDVLGAGGMGIVYRAEQFDPPRPVAVKVIRTANVSASLQRRFRHEAHALARLDHPGIARIYEVGIDQATGTAQPYIAMEYVEGVTLTSWARSTPRSLDEALELCALICDAVQHAHQKGVIHRDLKPGNILVDAQGRPHVVDFGVARIAGTDDAQSTLVTNPGQLVGTLQYMSPEQIEADPNDLDTRSDVYAIGVLMYELLAGGLPWKLEGRPVLEIVRVVREEEPARLGTVERRYRGDVEVIVARAMEPIRDRRYQSAQDVATDIRNYLTGRPINARRDSTVYVLSKQIRRHRVPITIALLIAILGSYVVYSIGRADEARERGLLLLSAFASGSEISDPFDDHRPTSEQLQAGEDWLRKEGRHDIEFSARVHNVVGLGYLKQPDLENARRHLEEALSIRRRPRTEPVLLAESLHNLGRVLYWQQEYAEAVALYQSALSMRQALLESTTDQSTARDLDERIADSMNDLGACFRRQGKLTMALAMYEGALEIRERRDFKGWIAASYNNIGLCRADLHLWDAARTGFREAVERIRIYGAREVFVVRALRNTAQCSARLGEHEVAQSEAAEALKLATAKLRASNREVLHCRAMVAECALLRGDLESALADAREVLAIMDHGRYSDADRTSILELVGRIELERGAAAIAVPLLERALIDRERRAPTHSDTLALMSDYGLALSRVDRHDEALDVMRRCDAICRMGEDVPPDLRSSVADRLAELTE